MSTISIATAAEVFDLLKADLAAIEVEFSRQADSPVAVVTDIAIYPIVGLIPPPGAWTIADEEVEAVIEASLAQLAASHRMQTFTRNNGEQVTTDAYTVGSDTMWGATARIVTELLARLGTLPGTHPA